MKLVRLVIVLVVCVMLSGLTAVSGAVAVMGEDIEFGSTTKDDVPRLIEILLDGGPNARFAGEDLERFGSGSLSALLDAMKKGADSDALRTTLYNIMDKDAVSVASGYVSDTTENVRYFSRALIRKAGDDASPAVIKMMGEPGTNEAAVDILKDTAKSRTTLELVRAQAGSGNPLSRAGAARVLGLVEDNESEDTLKRLMVDPDASVRTGAIEGYLSLYAAHPAKYDMGSVSAWLADTEPKVRAYAVEIVDRSGDREALGKIMSMLGTEKDNEVQNRIMDAMSSHEMVEAGLPILKLLDVNDTDTRHLSTVLYSLGALKMKEAVPYIMEVVAGDNKPDVVVSAQAIMSLKEIGEPVDIHPLLKYLESGEPHDTGTGDLLVLIEKNAKRGDEEVISALRAYMPAAERQYQAETVGRLLEGLQ